ncbi:MAG: hypothetical protein FJX76_19860 [Armatimonadetes bacterium]|nr:hypothetical protein [Armatimonadota bacterium]
MASDKEGAIQLANFFARASRDSDAARGMGELLDTLTMPEDGDRTKSRQVAESFSNATRWVSGAQGMREGFTNLLDQEGGGRAFSRLMHRFSGTSEGAQSTAGLLRQMSYDREGTHAVSTMLSRATASRDGARQMLDAFNRIAATDAGKHDVAMLLNRISQVDGGSRVLANLTADNANVRGFSELMDKLSENEEARGRVSGALENIASGGPAAEVGRITARAQQNQELGDSLSRFNWGQPQVEASPEVRLTTEGFGAKLLAEQGAADSTALIGESARGVVAPGGEPPSKDSTLHPGMESLLKNISSAPEAKESRPRSEHPRVQEVRPAPIDGPRQLFTFRPGDVYSEDTLREARICPDCGFRLSPGGVCLRCVAFEQRAINPQQVQVARTQEIEPQG